MKKGMEIPPALGIAVIVVVVLVAGFFLYKATAGKGKVEMPPEAKARMQQTLQGAAAQQPPMGGPPPGMGGQGGPRTFAGQRSGSVSGPPPGFGGQVAPGSR